MDNYTDPIPTPKPVVIPSKYNTTVRISLSHGTLFLLISSLN